MAERTTLCPSCSASQRVHSLPTHLHQPDQEAGAKELQPQTLTSTFGFLTPYSPLILYFHVTSCLNNKEQPRSRAAWSQYLERDAVFGLEPVRVEAIAYWLYRPDWTPVEKECSSYILCSYHLLISHGTILQSLLIYSHNNDKNNIKMWW